MPPIVQVTDVKTDSVVVRSLSHATYADKKDGTREFLEHPGEPFALAALKDSGELVKSGTAELAMNEATGEFDYVDPQEGMEGWVKLADLPEDKYQVSIVGFS